MTAINRLQEGDCFLYVTAQCRKQAAQHFRERMSILNTLCITPQAYDKLKYFQRMYAEPHIIECLTRESRDRVTVRVSDGKRFVWYVKTPAIVEYVDSRDNFERRLQEIADSRKRLAKEMQELRGKAGQKARKSKKLQKPEELETRTEVARQ